MQDLDTTSKLKCVHDNHNDNDGDGENSFFIDSICFFVKQDKAPRD